jgi:hypothetical protein
VEAGVEARVEARVLVGGARLSSSRDVSAGDVDVRS